MGTGWRGGLKFCSHVNQFLGALAYIRNLLQRLLPQLQLSQRDWKLQPSPYELTSRRPLANALVAPAVAMVDPQKLQKGGG